MKLIIDIDEGTLKEVNRCGLFLNPRDKENLVNSIKNGTSIPENATNGDVIKALFADNFTIDEFLHDTRGLIDHVTLRHGNFIISQFDKDWWNAPYKGSYTECCGNCFFFNGDTTDTQPQFCDEKEEYVNPVYRCIRYRQRGETV